LVLRALLYLALLNRTLERSNSFMPKLTLNCSLTLMRTLHELSHRCEPMRSLLQRLI
jgi:hypothetical protein